MSGSSYLPHSKLLPGDDAGLSEGQDTEADLTRAIVADGERLVQGRPTAVMQAGSSSAAATSEPPPPPPPAATAAAAAAAAAASAAAKAAAEARAKAAAEAGDGSAAAPSLQGRAAAAAAAAEGEYYDGYDDDEEDEEEAGGGYFGYHLEQAKLLLSGGVAGAFSKSCTAPLARLTILYQVNGMQSTAGGSGSSSTARGSAAAVRGLPPMHLGVGEALRHIVRTEGLAALWKGNGVTIVHRLPYSAANFWVYEHVSEMWKQRLPTTHGVGAAGDVVRRLVSGGIAGMTACALAYPLDLVRTRLAAQTSHSYYTGISQALRTIVADEGARGLYRGLGPTLLQVAPSLAINYAAYETMRSAWLARTDRLTPTVPMSLACGSAAGLISSTATFPLDLVRRRLQMRGWGGASSSGGSSQAGQQATIRSMFSSVVRREGLRGLYSGILPEYYKVVPGVAIAFCTYEMMKTVLGVQINATQR